MNAPTAVAPDEPDATLWHAADTMPQLVWMTRPDGVPNRFDGRC